MFFFHPGSARAAVDDHLCGPYYVRQGVLKSALNLNQLFNRNDRMLICGSDLPGWSEIPRSQAIYHIKTILNAAGYFNPEIQEEENKVLVIPKDRSFIEKVIFLNAPGDFEDRIFHGIKKQPLTPDALENAKNWSLSRLRSMGYPCPEVTVRAAYESETLVVDIRSGPKQKLTRVIRPETEELKTKIFSRYDAFDTQEWFNADMLALTSRRLIEQEVAQFATFEDQCTDDGAIATQKLVLGKPKTLLFAVGASTEEFPIFKSEWKNNRLDSYGSTATLELFTSSRRQALTARSQLYWFRNTPELYLTPSVGVTHRTEPTFKTLAQEFRFGLGHQNDDSRHHYSFNYTPVYTVEKTIEGEGPAHLQYLSFETTLQLMSHYYEFYRMAPQEGYQFGILWRAQREGAGSTFTADMLGINGTYLMNLGNYDPPLTVLGLRFGHTSVLTPNLDGLPPSFRLFLGGADDVRGFSRKSINNANRGYLTTSHLGFEARFLEVLPFKLQPLILADVAKVGEEAWTWNSDTYFSPGAGVRWQSPFGAIRGTIARGIVYNEDLSRPQPNKEWNLYFSYGREF